MVLESFESIDFSNCIRYKYCNIFFFHRFIYIRSIKDSTIEKKTCIFLD